MSIQIRSRQAADLLGVSPATLYAYVSRGRLTRTTASDGRTSLFDRNEVERLAERSRRTPPGPRATIDVQIRSAVTTLDATSLTFRGHDVVDLVRHHRFDDIAELLWSPDGTVPATPVRWPTAEVTDVAATRGIGGLDATAIGTLAIAAHVLDARHRADDAVTAARRLLSLAPALFGSLRRTGPFALRLASAWRRRPTEPLVNAVDTALGLLADHELATGTLAVRIAASVRASPYAAFASGLAALEGALHGSASAEVHRFLERCAEHGAAAVVAEARAARQLVPGFGHQVYRGIDPRFAPLLDAVRRLEPGGRAVAVVDDAIGEVGRTLPHQPNVDLALGALTWSAGLDADTPIFAVARIAGWAAHFVEELDERPLRFRGVARPR